MFLKLNPKLLTFFLFVSHVLIIFSAVFLMSSCIPTHSNLPRDKTLTIALETRVATTDPRLVGMDANSQYLESLRFLPLMGADPLGNIAYIAAQTAEVSNKGLTVKITLKPNLMLASGKRALNAADVVATYQTVMKASEPGKQVAGPTPDKLPPSPRRAAFSNVESLQTQGNDTVIFTLKEPDSAFLTNLVVGIMPQEALMLPTTSLQGQGFESGPFVLETSNDQQVIFNPNPHYSLGPKPKIPYVQFLILPDAGTRFAALLRGDVDVVQNALDPDKIQEIRKERSEQFEILTGPRLSTTYIGINFRNPLLQDLRVRQAIAHALPTQDVIRYRLQGLAVPAHSMFPEGFYYHDSRLPHITYDPQKSKKLLEDFAKETKHPLPISFSLKVASNTRSNVDAANILSMALNDVGFNIQVEPLENSIFFSDLRKGLSQLWLATWVGFKDPDHLRFVFSNSMIPPKGANRGAYNNPELEMKFTQGKLTVEEEKRREIYDKIQSTLAEDLAYVYLWHNQNTAAVNKRIQGYQLYADGRYASLAGVTLNPAEKK